METSPEQRLDAHPEDLSVHRRRIPGYPNIVLDPCVA
jgi:hypothetical protein